MAVRIRISIQHDERLLVVAEDGAECTVIEEYFSVGGNAYFTNAVTEIAVAPTALLKPSSRCSAGI